MIRYGGAELATGIAKTRFIQRDGQVETVDESAAVLKLSDGSMCFVGDFDGGLFSGDIPDTVGPLGLNIPSVAELLRTCAARCSAPVLPICVGATIRNSFALDSATR